MKTLQELFNSSLSIIKERRAEQENKPSLLEKLEIEQNILDEFIRVYILLQKHINYLIRYANRCARTLENAS